MAKRFKCKAKKLSSGNDYSPCFFCGQKTLYSMTEKDGSEIWACFDCMWEEGKIKKFSPSRLKRTLEARKSKTKVDLFVKKTESDYQRSEMGVEE